MPESRSRAFRLKRSGSTAEEIRRIVAGRVESARDHLAATRGDADLAESIHAARKDLKKLRSVLRLARERLGDDVFRRENRRYRDVGRALSDSRDAQVKIETLERLRGRFDNDMPADAARAWHEGLVRERDEMVSAPEGGVNGRVDASIAELERGMARLDEPAIEGEGWKVIEPGLLRTYRRGRREMKRVLSEPSAENVHEWRKRCKDLWYQLHILARAWPPALEPMADQAHELADLLGDHQDLSVLAADLRRRPELEAEGRFVAMIRRRQSELVSEALELGRCLYAESPKAFGARMRAYWNAWQG